MPRISVLPFRQLHRSVQSPSVRRAPLSTSSIRYAADPFKDQADLLKPGKAPRPDGEPTPARDPSAPSDAFNPALQGYPSTSGQRTTSTATPDLTTPDPPTSSTNDPTSRPANPFSSTSPEQTRQPNTPPRAPTGGQPLSQSLFTQTQRAPRSAPQGALAREGGRRMRASETKAAELNLRAIENTIARRYKAGDVYAPHDMSPAEQQKTRKAQNRGRKTLLDVNTRGKRQKDVLDVLNINPIKEYKNFALLADFVTNMGRIKHAKDTGLRGVNQRRMAKAVRRAIGQGLVPSVHIHPELMPERRAQRLYIREQIGSGGAGAVPADGGGNGGEGAYNPFKN